MPEIDAAPSHEVGGTSLAFLDGARAVAALFVVTHHVYLHPPGVNSGSDIYHWQGAQKVLGVFWWGHFAVSLFIVLSGFCLAMGPERRGVVPAAGPFLLRRARRILPPYYGALILSLVLIATLVGEKTGTHWDYSLPVTLRAVAARALLLNVVAPGEGSINHVFWSIAVEWHLYFCFWPLLLLSRRFGWRRLLLLLTPLTLLAVHVAGKLLGSDASIAFLALFAFVMAAAHVVFAPRLSELRARCDWPLWSAAACLLFLIVLEGTNLLGRLQPFYRLDYLAGGAAALLLVTLCLRPSSKLHRILSHRWLVRIGAFSYSLYLIHAPLIQIAWQMGIYRIDDPRLAFAALLPVSLALSVIGAYLFYVAFERPFVASERHV